MPFGSVTGSFCIHQSFLGDHCSRLCRFLLKSCGPFQNGSHTWVPDGWAGFVWFSFLLPVALLMFLRHKQLGFLLMFACFFRPLPPSEGLRGCPRRPALIKSSSSRRSGKEKPACFHYIYCLFWAPIWRRLSQTNTFSKASTN